MKKIYHRHLGHIKIHVEFERFYEGKPMPVHVALAEGTAIVREDADSWRWNSPKLTAKQNLSTTQYYLIWGDTDDFANTGFTHLQTPSGRTPSFKSALKQFNDLVKATEFVTFKKI